MTDEKVKAWEEHYKNIHDPFFEEGDDE